MGSTISILSIVRVTSMQPKFRKNAWMGGYLGSSKSTGRELMETEMKLKNEFRNALCLRVKIFKAFWVLGCQIPVQVNDWSSTSLFWAPIFACTLKMLNSEQFVSSSRGSAFPPMCVSSCIPAPPSAGKVFVVVHVAGFGKQVECDEGG